MNFDKNNKVRNLRLWEIWTWGGTGDYSIHVTLIIMLDVAQLNDCQILFLACLTVMLTKREEDHFFKKG